MKSNLNLHILEGLNVRTNVTRLALCVSLLALTVQAAEPDLGALLKGTELRYNRAKTLQVQFNETYSVEGRNRKSETGTLTLRKPGRMRWEYTAPAGKLFLSDGKDVYLYTPDNKRVEQTKLKETEDMHAPMAFLLGKLDFAKEFRDFELKPEGTSYLLAAKAKTDKLPYERIQMLLTPDCQIQRLVVHGQDNSVLTFVFTGEKLNPSVDNKQFKFEMPPGAKIVNTEAGQ
jgi:outer membrane lipoprotein carrier protein